MLNDLMSKRSILKKKTNRSEKDEEEITTLEEKIAKECEEANIVKIMENFNDLQGVY